ncbi:MAG: cupin domain-containing protein [Tropicimonas sp.]|uniref:cupin domain-containing protein n=1 Tax=Tropicimonas sp. TaxID=2067044 RepID=UPI003A8714CD
MPHLRNFPIVDAPHGVKRQVLSENEQIMVVAFAFPEGGKGDLHQHAHVQSTYVQSGRFSFTMDGETFDVEAGDSFVIPSNALHGCTCLEAGRLIDTFTPRRDDFL